MSATRRLAKELIEIEKSSISQHCKIIPNSNNVLLWDGVLMPSSIPFDKYNFEFNMEFPSEYPFKPPKIFFKTKIYHPNIDEKGQLCMPIILAENWKPATKAEQVLQSLVALVNDPEVEQAIRTDVADEFIKNKQKFLKHALEFCKSYAIPRD